MIVDVNGRPATRKTERTLDQKLVARLIELEGLLREEGLSLFCIRCHQRDLPDGVVGDNRPDSDVYTLTCTCSRRVHHKRTGHLKVQVH